jgi:pimeloyl-ACP methyl ester carboxylesterase
MTSGAPMPVLDGVEHRFVDLPGLRMHVAEAGRGDPVLLLHGFPEHWWEWRKVIPALAEHYRLIVPDLRGAGWTDAPRTGYTPDQLVADVAGLLDVLGLERVRLVGHDWGALVGFLFCLYHPERAHQYISLAIPHPYVRFHPRLIPIAGRLWFQFAIATPVLGPLLLRTGNQPLARYLPNNFTSDRAAWSAEDLEIFMAPLRDSNRARAAAALYRDFIVPLFPRVIAGRYRHMRLSTPTRILYGSQDWAMRAEILGGYQDHADDLKLIRVEGASHFIADEKPDVVIAQTREFFGT